MVSFAPRILALVCAVTMAAARPSPRRELALFGGGFEDFVGEIEMPDLGIGTGLEDLVGGIGGELEDLVGGIGGELEDLVGGIGGVFDGLGGELETFGLGIADGVTSLGDDIADLTMASVDGVAAAAGDVGDFFEGDFVDFWEDDFVDFWEDDVANGMMTALGETLQFLGLGPDLCDICRSKLAEEPARGERCFAPVADKGFCNTETQKFAVEGCIKIADKCGACYAEESVCSASTESYDPTEAVCTEGDTAANIALCFASPDATTTPPTPGFCNAERRAFGRDVCSRTSTDPQTNKERKSIAQVCAKYYPESACTSCPDKRLRKDDGGSACTAVTLTYDAAEEMCLAQAGRCFEAHTSEGNGLCHAEYGLFVSSACSVVPHRVDSDTGKRAKSIAVQCGQYFPQSPCSSARATLSEEQMEEHNHEQLCASDGLCSSVSRCYEARADTGGGDGLCDAGTGLFLTSKCQAATACAVCFTDSPCVGATEPVSAAKLAPAEEMVMIDQWCTDQCSEVNGCWVPHTEHTANGVEGLCDSDTGHFRSSECSSYVACARCFDGSPCRDATGTAPQVDTTSTTTETSTTSITTTITTTTTTETATTTTTKTATTPPAAADGPIITVEGVVSVLHDLLEGTGLDSAADIVAAIESKLEIDTVVETVGHDLASLIEHAAVVDVLRGFGLSDDVIASLSAAASSHTFEVEDEETPGGEKDSAVTAAVSTIATLAAVVVALL